MRKELIGIESENTKKKRKSLEVIFYQKNPQLKKIKHKLLINRMEVIVDGKRIPFYKNGVKGLRPYELHYDEATDV